MHHGSNIREIVKELEKLGVRKCDVRIGVPLPIFMAIDEYTLLEHSRMLIKVHEEVYYAVIRNTIYVFTRSGAGNIVYIHEE